MREKASINYKGLGAMAPPSPNFLSHSILLLFNCQLPLQLIPTYQSTCPPFFSFPLFLCKSYSNKHKNERVIRERLKDLIVLIGHTSLIIRLYIMKHIKLDYKLASGTRLRLRRHISVLDKQSYIKQTPSFSIKSWDQSQIQSIFL
jgi:hypothetical protein